MKKIMKFVSLAFAAVMALSMTACGGASAKYNVGVCQLVQHPALDAATEGFKAALEEKLGDAVYVDVQVASERQYTDGTIAPHLLGMVGPITNEEYEKKKEEGYTLNDVIGK